MRSGSGGSPCEQGQLDERRVDKISSPVGPNSLLPSTTESHCKNWILRSNRRVTTTDCNTDDWTTEPSRELSLALGTVKHMCIVVGSCSMIPSPVSSGQCFTWSRFRNQHVNMADTADSDRPATDRYHITRRVMHGLILDHGVKIPSGR